MVYLSDAKQLIKSFPRLDSEQRTALYSSFDEGAVCDFDFMIMMCLSTTIAALGLLINSPAVIIGAMVVAPLMTPLIAAGCALVRGNLPLFFKSIRAMIFGSLAALGVSLLLGSLVPTDTLTLEMIARGTPDILDLFVALFSGVAAAYATARPKVVAALVGVAVAAALVPPIATTGLALIEGKILVAKGAGILFITNLVAIIIGAAAMFYLMGIRSLYENKWSPLILRRVFLSLLLVFGLLSAPLGYQTADRIKKGQLRPIAYPLSLKLSELIRDRVEQEPDVDLLSAGRSGYDYEAREIEILLSSSEPGPLSLKEDLVSIVKEYLGKEVRVRIIILEAERWVES
jgi:uncharacterized hydrophobic protein (TIGR00271 family)